MIMNGRLLALLLSVVILAILTPKSFSETLYFYGRVTDTGLNPIAGAEVSVFSNNLLVASTLTDKDGVFNLRIPPGTYILRVYLKGYAPREILLVATQEKAGSLGTILLEPAITIYTETTQLTAYQGDFLNLTVKISNKGLDALPVYFSIESPSSWTCYLTLPGGLRVSNILVEAGSERTLYFNLAVPVDASGKNTIRLTVSWGNQSRSISYEIDVQPKRWNIIELPATSIKAYPGAQLKIPLQVSNPFPVTADIALAVEQPEGWVASIIDTNSITITGLSLNPKNSKQLFLILYVPTSARFGVYSLSLDADIRGSRFITKLNIAVESRYDLLNLTVGVTTLNMTGGASTVIPVILRNDGNMATIVVLRAVSSNENIKAILSVSGQPSSTVYMAPGESRQVNLILNATPLLAPGIYQVKVQANGTTSYSEKLVLINVVGKYGFRIVNQDFLINVAPGSTTTYSLIVNNTGTYPLSPLVVRFIEVPENFHVTIQPESLVLLPGETGTFTIQIATPSDAREGVYNLVLSVESGSISDSRILLVWVRSESSISFVLIMSVLVAASFLLVFYGRRKYS